jgi:hypothetical protein
MFLVIDILCFYYVYVLVHGFTNRLLGCSFFVLHNDNAAEDTPGAASFSLRGDPARGNTSAH